MDSFLFTFLLLTFSSLITVKLSESASERKCYQCMPHEKKKNFSKHLAFLLNATKKPDGLPANKSLDLTFEYLKKVEDCSEPEKVERTCGDHDTVAWGALLVQSGIDFPRVKIDEKKIRRRRQQDSSQPDTSGPVDSKPDSSDVAKPGKELERKANTLQKAGNKLKDLADCFKASFTGGIFGQFLRKGAEDESSLEEDQERFYKSPISDCKVNTFTCLKAEKDGEMYKACVPFRLEGCQETVGKNDTKMTICGCQNDLCNHGASSQKISLLIGIGSVLLTLLCWKYIPQA